MVSQAKFARDPNGFPGELRQGTNVDAVLTKYYHQASLPTDSDREFVSNMNKTMNSALSHRFDKIKKGVLAQEAYEADMLAKQKERQIEKEVKETAKDIEDISGLNLEVLKNLTEKMTDTAFLEQAQNRAVELFETKRVGTFDGVPVSVMKKSNHNVMRDLKPEIVQTKVQDIGSKWWNQTPMVGCITNDQWQKAKTYFTSLAREKPEEFKPYLNDLVITLDGQHRVAAAEQLLEKEIIKDPKITLHLFVDLSDDDMRAISIWYNHLQTSMAEITLVDLLRQMR